MTAMCACGRPLHYHSELDRAAVQRLVDDFGETIALMVPGVGTYMVPRHYIALHGIHGQRLPELAELYNWEKKQ